MGAVYRVVHAPTGARRALKLVTRHTPDPTTLERFAREGRALAAVGGHPNVVRVHDAGTFEERPYLVMELCTGGDLAGRLRQGPLAPAEAARVVADVARGMAHVHARGIVHRDLKPQNVLFDEHGRPRVTDFGIARLVGADRLTATGGLVGTPTYMAPEQAESKEVDARADVWSLGGILIATLTGRPPYEGGNDMNVVFKVLKDEPRWPSADRPDTPPALEAIVKRAMARRRMDRYPDAGALADDLERFLRGELDAPRARPRWPLAAVAVLLVAVGGGLGRWQLRHTHDPDPRQPASAPGPEAPPRPDPPALSEAPPPRPKEPGAEPVGMLAFDRTITSLVFVADRRVVAAASGGLVLLHLEDRHPPLRAPGPPRAITNIACVGTVIYAAEPRPISRLAAYDLVDAGLAPPREVLPPGLEDVCAVASDGAHVLAVSDLPGHTKVLALPGLEVQATIPPVEGKPSRIKLLVTHDGAHVVRLVGREEGADSLGVFRTLGGAPVWTLDEPHLRAIGWRSAGELLIGFEKGRVRRTAVGRHDPFDELVDPRFRDVQGAGPLQLVTDRAHSESVLGFVASRDGRRLWTFSRNEVQGWELVGDELKPVFQVAATGGRELAALALSPDEERLVVARSVVGPDPNAIRVWNVER